MASWSKSLSRELPTCICRKPPPRFTDTDRLGSLQVQYRLRQARRLKFERTGINSVPIQGLIDPLETAIAVDNDSVYLPAALFESKSCRGRWQECVPYEG